VLCGGSALVCDGFSVAGVGRAHDRVDDDDDGIELCPRAAAQLGDRPGVMVRLAVLVI